MANFSKSDLEFILKQIFIAEAHADGASLIDLLPNSQVPFGLRTVMAASTTWSPGKASSAPLTTRSCACSMPPTAPTMWAPAMSSIHNRAPSVT